MRRRATSAAGRGTFFQRNLVCNYSYIGVLSRARPRGALMSNYDPIFPRSIKDDPPVSDLTPRQLEIMQSSDRGLTNDDLAKLFGISPSGVKHHLSTIFAKLGASSRSEDVFFVCRTTPLISRTG